MNTTSTVIEVRSEPKPVLPAQNELLWAGVAEVVVAVAAVAYVVRRVRRRRSTQPG